MVRSGNPNHPKKGSSIMVEPIRSRKDIAQIKALLSDKPRDKCLFVVGINTGFRAIELLSLTIGQVEYLYPGDVLRVKQSKTGEYRMVQINAPAYGAICAWLSVHPRRDDPNAPLFLSRKTGEALTTGAVCQMIKGWCREIGLNMPVGSKTLRMTWGYHQRVTYGQPISLICRAYGHSSEEITRRYIGILPREVGALYGNEV